MGYRSDVRITTTKNGYKELEKYVKEHLSDDICNLLEKTDIFQEGNDYVYLGWNYMKWYDNYDEVEVIMKGIEHLKDKNIAFHYARLGEDYDDYEEIYNETYKDGCIKEYVPAIWTIRTFDDVSNVERIGGE